MMVRMRLDALLAAAAGRHAARPALAGERDLSHAEFLADARSVAAALRAAGCARDEPLHVRVSNHPADLEAFFGAWLAGAVVVPVHRASPALAAAQVAACTQARFEWDALAAAPLVRLAEAPPPPRDILREAALVVFTSGSSGAPKGAVLSHRAFAGQLGAIQQRLAFGADERTLLVLNITFSFGIWVALLTLAHGGCVLPAERFVPGTFLRRLKRDAITRVAVVPTMMRALVLDHPDATLSNGTRRPHPRRPTRAAGRTFGPDFQGIRGAGRRTVRPAESGSAPAGPPPAAPRPGVNGQSAGYR
jgi:long-chain acyl-CoA synthetase